MENNAIQKISKKLKKQDIQIAHSLADDSSGSSSQVETGYSNGVPLVRLESEGQESLMKK